MVLQIFFPDYFRFFMVSQDEGELRMAHFNLLYLFFLKKKSSKVILEEFKEGIQMVNLPSFFSLSLFPSVELGVKRRASHMLGITELHPQPNDLHLTGSPITNLLKFLSSSRLQSLNE